MQETMLPRTIRWLRVVALAVALVLCMSAIVALAWEVTRKLEALQNADEDNVEWTLSQVEVEYLQLKLAATSVVNAPEPNLSYLRQRYDVFYSRVDTLKRSELYSYLTATKGVSAHLNDVMSGLNQTVAFIDADDQTLRQKLPELRQRIADMQMSVRLLSLAGLKNFAAQSDTQRESVASTLLRLGILTGALVFALMLLSALLLRLYRVSDLHAADRRAAAKRLSTIISTSLDAIIVVDAEGVVLEFNGAAASIFGYAPEEAIGKSVSRLIVPERYIAAHNAGMRRFTRTSKRRLIGAGYVSLTARRRDGSEFPIELSLEAVDDVGETIFVSFIRDVTAEKNAENELVKARDAALANERSKAEFFAVMSHEMRTPLNGLLGTLSLLKADNLSPKQSKYIETMEASGRLLLHHVNDVLEISKTDAGKTDNQKTEFNLLELTESIVNAQKPAADVRGNTLEFNWLSEPISSTYSDPIRIQQILLNLIGNAIKFTKNGNITLEMEVYRKQSDFVWVEFRVADNGIGIAADDLDRIFKDFETVDASYRRDTNGTGLGLGIAKRMVTSLGGEIGLESELSVGSVFWFRLPLKMASFPSLPPVAEQVADKKPGPAQALNILIVDDNETNRFVLREMLAESSGLVREAENGAIAVDMANETCFDLILMDISMPVMDGFEAVELIRDGNGASQYASIIAVTAHAMESEISRYKKSGMDDYLVKPLQREALNAMLAAVRDRYTQALSSKPRIINGQMRSERAEAKIELPPLNTTNTKAPRHIASSDQALLEHDRIHSLKSDLGKETAEVLIARFKQEADETLGAFVEAPPGSLLTEDVIEKLHRVAGSAAQLGFHELRKELNHLERLGKAGRETELWAARERLNQLWVDSYREYQSTYCGANDV